MKYKLCFFGSIIAVILGITGPTLLDSWTIGFIALGIILVLTFMLMYEITRENNSSQKRGCD